MQQRGWCRCPHAAPARLAAALDASVPHVYLAASLAFLTAAALRLAGGTGALSGNLLRAGTLLRVPASGLLCVGALAHLAADWAESAAAAAAAHGDGNAAAAIGDETSPPPPPPAPPRQRPRHVLDWPAAYTNVASCGGYLMGSIAIAAGGWVGIPLGSVSWLVGSALAVVQSVLLLAVEAERAGALRAVAAARARASLSRSASEPAQPGHAGSEAGSPPRSTHDRRAAAGGSAQPAPMASTQQRRHRSWCYSSRDGGSEVLARTAAAVRAAARRARRRLRPLALLPVALSAVFLCASLLFVAGSAVYLARQNAPFQLPAEGCFAAGSCLFIAGTLAAGGCAGAAPAVTGLINRHRRGALSAAPAGADEEAAVTALVAELLATPVVVEGVVDGGAAGSERGSRAVVPAGALAGSAVTTVAIVQV
jgi:hypothetical protein